MLTADGTYLMCGFTNTPLDVQQIESTYLGNHLFIARDIRTSYYPGLSPARFPFS
jgi:hypothetical protein